MKSAEQWMEELIPVGGCTEAICEVEDIRAIQLDCCKCPKPTLERAGSVAYRLLNRSDVICLGDEGLLDDCKTWEALEQTNPHIGQRYCGNLFVPMRRLLPNS